MQVDGSSKEHRVKISGLTFPQLKKWVTVDLGMKPFRAQQLFSWPKETEASMTTTATIIEFFIQVRIRMHIASYLHPFTKSTILLNINGI